MIILITQGGVQNWATVDYVICARSLTEFDDDICLKTDEQMEGRGLTYL